MTAISNQTLDLIGEQLYDLIQDRFSQPGVDKIRTWGSLSQEERDPYILFAADAIDVCRLPNEIDLRKRLLSDDGRHAAGAEIDFYLPEGFVFPAEHSEMDTGDLFVAALVAALTETPPGG
jgi:hypothetical protein